MRHEDQDLTDEIRGHLALSIQERIAQGEDPESARRAALAELGGLMATRESMRGIWRNRWIEGAGAFAQDLRIAFRSLRRAKGLSFTVAVTLALGIGANAAVFSVVRQVLLRPLVNRDGDRLVYLRQSALGLGNDNTTFSVPEIQDLRKSVRSIAAFGEFSTMDFPMSGLGEPRVVQAGLVDGAYFDVVGLKPILGRLLGVADDGPRADGAIVLTHRFWATALNSDPTVIGKHVRIGSRPAVIVGVLEPSVPYPADTEIIANIVCSPHHLGATMTMQRTHRMTELFGRLAPGATVESARAELTAAHAAIVKQHPEAYSPSANMALQVTLLRDQITAPARTILLGLLAAAGIVFLIACSNVANLILARSVRREKELTVRAALGAGTGALRRTLLAESVLLCGAGAVLGLVLARPLVAIVSGYAARFSVRALDVSVDASLLWVGAGLAMLAAVALAYVPRLPSAQGDGGLASGGLRLTPGTNRRLRGFAVAQIALSFVLLATAGMILSALLALQTASTGYDMRHVVAVDVPLPLEAGLKAADFYHEATRRVAQLPGVESVAAGSFVPWRDSSNLLPTMPFRVEGFTPADGEEDPRARLRAVSPGFFATLGVPLVAGRDFTEEDKRGNEAVVIVSQTLAQRLFPNGQALNRAFWWTETLIGKIEKRRIVGISADVDDQNVVPRAAMTVYHPYRQFPYVGRLFVRTAGDPYVLGPSITKTIRAFAPDQPVERAATLADIRAEVLAPERLNAFVFSVFAGVALLIAVVGVAGVLAFSVSARMREFGVRLAVGSAPRHLLIRVLSEGARIALFGIAVGAVAAMLLGAAAGSPVDALQPSTLAPIAVAAVLLVASAIVASLLPAARAARVDVMQALRSE